MSVLISSFGACTVIVWENVLIYRKYTLKYSVVMGYHVGNLISSWFTEKVLIL